MMENLEKYPFIRELLEEKVLLEIDFFFAIKFCLKKDENILLALALLFAVSRNGHLCLKIEDEKIYPSLDWLFIENLKTRRTFEKKLIEGFNNIPDEIVEKDNLLEPEKIAKPIIFYNGSYYLHKNFYYEGGIKKEFLRLINNSLPKAYLKDRICREIEDSDYKLQDLQREAIYKGIENNISFIFGGPGTGKTFTAALLMKIFAKVNGEDTKIILTAPTGKATLNLESKLKNFSFQPSISVKAQTLHSLLQVNCSFDYGYIEADLIIVDEASMIDAKIMKKLLEKVHEKTNLVIIGDPYQLPPVETGNLFSVFFELGLRDRSTILEKCMRNSDDEMSELSSAVKEGDVNLVIKLFQRDLRNIVFKDLGESIQKLLDVIFEKVDKYYLPFSSKELDQKILLKNFSSFKILTALKNGFLGVDNLNKIIFDYIRSKIDKENYFSFPIMMVKNDYHLNLFNGTLGIVVRKKEGNNIEEIAYFVDEQNSEAPLRAIPLNMISNYTYSYVLSIHKSQGSEFEDVLAVFNKTSFIFGRELLYTAITRTKKHLTVIADNKTLKEIIRKKTEIQNNLLTDLSKITV